MCVFGESLTCTIMLHSVRFKMWSDIAHFILPLYFGPLTPQSTEWMWSIYRVCTIYEIFAFSIISILWFLVHDSIVLCSHSHFIYKIGANSVRAAAMQWHISYFFSVLLLLCCCLYSVIHWMNRERE